MTDLGLQAASDSCRLLQVYEITRILASGRDIARSLLGVLEVLARSLSTCTAVAFVTSTQERGEVIAWSREGLGLDLRRSADTHVRAAHDYFMDRGPFPESSDAETYLVLPLVLDRRVVGAVQVDGRGLSEPDLAYLGAVVNLLAVLVARLRPAAAAAAPERLPVGLLTLSGDGVVRDLDETAATMLGVDREGARQLPLGAVLTVDDEGALLAHLGGPVRIDERPVESVVTPRSCRERRLHMVSQAQRGRPDVRLVQLTNVTDRAVEERSRRLVGESATLHASLDPSVVLGRLCRLLVPAIADLAVVDLVVAGPRLSRREVVHQVDPQRARRFEAVECRWGVLPNIAFASLEALRTLQPKRIPEVHPHYLERAAASDEHLAALMSLALRSWLVLPLVDPQGRALGLLRLATFGMRPPFGEHDVALGERMAVAGAAALANAQEHRRVVNESKRLADVRSRSRGAMPLA